MWIMGFDLAGAETWTVPDILVCPSCPLYTDYCSGSNFLHNKRMDLWVTGWRAQLQAFKWIFLHIKRKKSPFWSSVSLAIFQFESSTHKKLREPGSCQHDSLHCMVDSPCEPCNDLEGKFVNFKKSVWDTAVPKSLLPSSAIIAS
jgi:hypothetical protein